MSKNKNHSSSKKYISNDSNDTFDDELATGNSHYYQNASAIRTRLDRGDNLMLNSSNINNINNINSNENHILASSSSSSQKPLISTQEKQLDSKYFFLILSSVCLVASLIVIAITFIFPFWLNLKFAINAANPSLPVNITNTNTGLILIGLIKVFLCYNDFKLLICQCHS